MSGRSRADVAPAPWSFAAPWGGRGQVSELDGPVHWIDFGPAGGAAAPIVFVHGLGGSHLNWCLIGPALAAGRRAYALDLHGFGLSPAQAGNSTIAANTLLLDRFLATVVGEPAVLVGNSMGGLISIRQAATRPESVVGLALLDPALPTPRQRPDLQVARQFLIYAMPGLGEAYMRRVQSRLTPRQQVQRIVDLCFADPSRASAELLDAGVDLAVERQSIPDKEQAFLVAARSLLRVLMKREEYRAMMRRVEAPTLLVNGAADRLVPLAAAQAAAADNPEWESLFLPDVGHTPQLEAPDLVISAITDWLARHPALNHSEQR
jgi:pimeloyl-ACP methyl ester carboxylesterase